MKALLWKEFRENLRWAALALLAVSAAFLFSFSSYTPSWYVNHPILSAGVQTVTAIGFPLVAFALGLLQTIRENRRDAWAFLVHRPISRSEIFAAKTIVGVSFYFASVAIPFTVTLIYCLIPGHVAAPFDWRMVSPTVADALAGVAYYFVAYLISLRHARWLGSRLLPIGLAMMSSIFVVAIPHFSYALIPISIAIPVTFLAARGAFVAGGEYTPQPNPSKSSLYFSVGVGAFVLGAVLLGLLFSAFVPTPTFTYNAYHMTPAGQIVRLTTDNLGSVTSVTDLAGHPLPDNEESRALHSPMYYSKLISFSSLQLTPPPKELAASMNYRTGQYYMTDFGQDGPLHWFYLLNARRLQGFDTATKRWVASAGPDGFVPAPQIPRSFPDEFRPGWANYQSLRTIAFPSAAYRFDFYKQSVQRFFTPPPGQSIVGAIESNEPEHPFIAVSSERAVHLFNKDGAPLFETPIAVDAQKYKQVQIAIAKPSGAVPVEHFILWYSSLNWWSPEAAELPPQIYRIVPPVPGNPLAHPPIVAEHIELPPLPAPGTLNQDPYQLLFAPFIPPLGLIVAGVANFFTEHKPLATVVRTATRTDWISLAIILAAAALASFVTSRLARRHAFLASRRRRWTITNFFLGFPGLVTMLLTVDLPPRVPCPSCQKPRPLDRDECPHCNAPFPAPTPDGTEIFETAAA